MNLYSEVRPRSCGDDILSFRGADDLQSLVGSQIQRIQPVVCMRCLERDLKGRVEAICHAKAPSTKRTRTDTIFMYCVFANAICMGYR